MQSRKIITIYARVITLALLVFVFTTLGTAYAIKCLKVLESKHFKICAVKNFGTEDLEETLRLLEKAYDIYVDKLGLKILPPCGQDKYLVIVGTPFEISFGNRCVRTIQIASPFNYAVYTSLAFVVVNAYVKGPVSARLIWIQTSLTSALADVYGLNYTNYCNLVAVFGLHGFEYNYTPFFMWLIEKFGPREVLEEAVARDNFTWLREQWVDFLLDGVRRCVPQFLPNGSLIYLDLSRRSSGEVSLSIEPLTARYIVAKIRPGIINVSVSGTCIVTNPVGTVLVLNHTLVIAVASICSGVSARATVRVAYVNVTSYLIHNVDYSNGKVVLNVTVIKNGLAVLSAGKPYLLVALEPANVTTVTVHGVPVIINMTVHARIIPVASSGNVKLILVEKIHVLNETFSDEKVMAVLDLSQAKLTEHGLEVPIREGSRIEIQVLRYGVNEVKVGNYKIRINVSRPVLTLEWPWIVAKIKVKVGKTEITESHRILNMELVLDTIMKILMILRTMLVIV